MSTQLDLQNLERTAYRATFQDGLFDAMLGLTMGVMSLLSWLEGIGWQRPFAYLILFTILTPIWIAFIALKKGIVAPRLGLVTFAAARRKQRRQLFWANILMVLLTLLMMVWGKQGRWGNLTDGGAMIIAGTIFITGFSVIAYFLDYPRLYLYGWLFALAEPLSMAVKTVIETPFPNGFTLIALVIFAVGLVAFIQFLRRYPLIENPYEQ